MSVDTVVGAHYTSFNQSLQKYSDILQLFSRSQDGLQRLRNTLNTAGRQLNPESKNLKDVYLQDIVLSETIRILGDVETASLVPDKVAVLEEKEEWTEAVRILVDGCNRVAREELQDISALEHVRLQLVECRISLLGTLIAQLKEQVLEMGERHRPSHGKTGPMAESPIGTYGARHLAGGGDRSVSREKHRVQQNPIQVNSIGPSQLGKGSTMEQLESSSFGRQNREINFNATGTSVAPTGHLLRPDTGVNVLVACIAQLDGVDKAMESLRTSLPHLLRHVLITMLQASCASYQRKFSDLLTGSEDPSIDSAEGSTRFEDLAAAASKIFDSFFMGCASMLGSLMRLLQSLATARSPAASLGIRQVCHTHDDDAKLQTAFDSSAAHSFEKQRDIASLDGSAGSSNELTVTTQRQMRSFEDSLYAWKCLQSECQIILAALFGTMGSWDGDTSRPESRSAQLLIPSSGWLSANTSDGDVAAKEEKSENDPMSTRHQSRNSMLLYSVEVELLEHEKSEPVLSSPSTGAITSPPQESLLTENARAELGDSFPLSISKVGSNQEGNNGHLDGKEYEKLLHETFSGDLGSNALMAAACVPAGRMILSCQRMMIDLAHRMSWMPSSPSFVGSKAGTNARSSNPPTPTTSREDLVEEPFLAHFLDSCLKMIFLPNVAESMFNRCNKTLKGIKGVHSASIHRISAAMALPPSHLLRKSPLLPAAFDTESMVDELLNYVLNIPTLSTHLFGVLDNVIYRILGGLHSLWESISKKSIIAKLVCSVSVSHLMSQEKRASLLGDYAYFTVYGNTDPMARFLSSAVASGAGEFRQRKPTHDVDGHLAAQRSLVALLLQEELTIEESNLLIPLSEDISNVKWMAYIANSANYIADILHEASSSMSTLADKRTDATSPSSRGSDQPSPRFPDGAKQTLRRLWKRTPQQGHLSQEFDPRLRTFSKGLMQSADRFRSLSGCCVRALRLDVLLTVMRGFRNFASKSTHPTVRNIDQDLLELARTLQRGKEMLEQLLPSKQWEYIYQDCMSDVAWVAVLVLPECSPFSSNREIREICDAVSKLEKLLPPTLNSTPNAGCIGGNAIHWAVSYISLAMKSADEVLKEAEEKPDKYTAEEWLALMDLTVPGRLISAESREKLKQLICD